MALDEHQLVAAALLELQKDIRWYPNYIKWTRLDEAARTKWWRLAKAQAEKGAPAMQTLVLKVIELRMKR